jgi:hypothetical protein
MYTCMYYACTHMNVCMIYVCMYIYGSIGKKMCVRNYVSVCVCFSINASLHVGTCM